MSPWKSKIIPITGSSGISRERMWCRGGNHEHHQGLGAVKLLLRKPQSLPSSGKMQGPALLFWKQRTRFDFPLRNSCCLGVTMAQGIFSSLHSFLMFQTKGKKQLCRELTGISKPRKIFFFSPKILKILSLNSLFLHQGV